MVVVLTLDSGAGCINTLVELCDRSFGRRVMEMTYADLMARNKAPRAAYILTDRIRMNRWQIAMAEEIRQGLCAVGLPTFNDPMRQLGRFDLLTKLHDLGINQYRVHRCTDDLSDVRFPVFVRRESDHNGPRTALINDVEALRTDIARLILYGIPATDLIVVEYQDSRDSDGYFRKYSVWLIGGQFYAQHVFSGRDWLVKSQTDDIDQSHRESDEYHLLNPHVELIRPIFELAGIEYGRIDFGFTHGQIQVWEINDNPAYLSATQNTFGRIRKDLLYMNQFDQMSSGVEAGPPFPLDNLKRRLRAVPC